jgi:hypothetical protein
MFISGRPEAKSTNFPVSRKFPNAIRPGGIFRRGNKRCGFLMQGLQLAVFYTIFTFITEKEDVF